MLFLFNLRKGEKEGHYTMSLSPDSPPCLSVKCDISMAQCKFDSLKSHLSGPDGIFVKVGRLVKTQLEARGLQNCRQASRKYCENLVKIHTPSITLTHCASRNFPTVHNFCAGLTTFSAHF